jgi:hypothetical protein
MFRKSFAVLLACYVGFLPAAGQAQSQSVPASEAPIEVPEDAPMGSSGLTVPLVALGAVVLFGALLYVGLSSGPGFSE